MPILIRAATSADAIAMGHINVDAWRATYTGLIDQAVLDAMTYETYIDKWTRHLSNTDARRFMLVAEVDGIVVGYASGGANRDPSRGFDAELYALYLLEAYHGQGIGRELFVQGLRQLHGQHFTGLSLYVLASNTVGRRFYDRYNPDVRFNATVKIEGSEYCDLGYGWHSIEKVLAL